MKGHSGQSYVQGVPPNSTQFFKPLEELFFSLGPPKEFFSIGTPKEKNLLKGWRTGANVFLYLISGPKS